MMIEPSLADYILGGVIGVTAWLFNNRMAKSDDEFNTSVAKTEECLKHVQKNFDDLAREFNQFRIDYTKEHGIVTATAAEAKGKAASIEQTIGSHAAITQATLQTLAQLKERVDGQAEELKWNEDSNRPQHEVS